MQFDSRRPIAFMHVPKTSGMALRTALEASTNMHGPAPGFDRSAFGDFADFDTVDPMLLRNIYLDGRVPPLDASFITGHMSASTLTVNRAGVQLITVLREPRSRLLSLWLFWRGLPDDQLQPWGKWAEYMRTAFKPLAGFLSDRNVASNTDNVLVRMVLWPHPDIPDNGFIKQRADEHLLSAAMAKLETFAFVDLVENPQLAANLQAWLGRPFIPGRLNDTKRLPLSLCSPLSKELTEESFELLDARSRLDRELWLAFAHSRVSHMEAEVLAERTVIRNVARHSMLMALSDERVASQKEICALGREINALGQEINALRQETIALGQQTNALRQEGSGLKREISAIRNSTSWKITAPLRALGRLRQSSKVSR